jgi:hypothetical protein
MHSCETVAPRSAHSHTHLPRAHMWVRRMPQREPHADTPCTPCWARCGGSHNGIPFLFGYFGLPTLISRPGLIPCRVVYLTHKHNPAVFNMPHFTPTASSDDCSMWLLPARPMRARTVPRVSTKSTRCEHSQHPIWVPLPLLERPMRVLRVFMRASKEPHAGIHRIHESTLSILSDHLQYLCEYSEYRM